MDDKWKHTSFVHYRDSNRAMKMIDHDGAVVTENGIVTFYTEDTKYDDVRIPLDLIADIATRTHF